MAARLRMPRLRLRLRSLRAGLASTSSAVAATALGSTSRRRECHRDWRLHHLHQHRDRVATAGSARSVPAMTSSSPVDAALVRCRHLRRLRVLGNIKGDFAGGAATLASSANREDETGLGRRCRIGYLVAPERSVLRQRWLHRALYWSDRPTACARDTGVRVGPAHRQAATPRAGSSAAASRTA